MRRYFHSRSVEIGQVFSRHVTYAECTVLMHNLVDLQKGQKRFKILNQSVKMAKEAAGSAKPELTENSATSNLERAGLEHSLFKEWLTF